ncbi:hypothetical protein [Parabacteroides johnsonii]|jgi:hypothetical protein|uniref:hypothetical protein n=1 Tax=Parabacteroides johnsonii TaxID=387661 RepID=UPI00241DB1B7|nr:hypothetical protein [Parabacteroides johnsonii]
MTQKEFEDRTGWLIKAEDFYIINNLYMATEMDKDVFCKEFRSMQASGKLEIRQSLKEIANHIGVMEAENQAMKKAMNQQNADLADFLIGKAHAYDDTDFRNEAVKLVGEIEVVKRTIELGLPLWDEDRKYILSMIITQGNQIAG